MSIKSLQRQHHRRIVRQLVILAVVTLAACALFVGYDMDWTHPLILQLRLKRFIGLVIVGANLSMATALFQGITRNYIISPSIMGFEAIYSLIVTVVVFFFGDKALHAMPPLVVFLIQLSLMVLLSLTVFLNILKASRDNLYLMVLIGLILGTFFRSLTSMMMSILDPNEFQTVQAAQTASFSIINDESLAFTIVASLICWGLIWFCQDRFEIMALGRDTAISLGVHYAQTIRQALALSAILVACSTALVGPLTFYGLLIAQLAMHYLDSGMMRYLIPATGMIGVTVLIGAQGILEHILKQATILPVVLEFVGGTLLLILIAKGARR